MLYAMLYIRPGFDFNSEIELELDPVPSQIPKIGMGIN